MRDVTVGAARLRVKSSMLRLRRFGLDNHLNSARLPADGGARFPDSMVGPTLRGYRRAVHARSDFVMTSTLQACQGPKVSVRQNRCVLIAVVVSCSRQEAEGAVSEWSPELVPRNHPMHESPRLPRFLRFKPVRSGIRDR